MTINAYPLIYSRTKFVDFVPDFLARPADLDYKTANGFVHSTMKNIDLSNEIRSAVFAVGEYCICTGIAGSTERIAEMTGRSESDSINLRDENGRKINAFIGFAVKKPIGKADIFPI